MRAYIELTGTWESLGEEFEMFTEPSQEINKATQIAFTIPQAHYAKLSTWIGTWIDDCPRIAITPDAVTAANLNADMDACNILWLGRATRIGHEENEVMLYCEELLAFWERQPITQDDNVVTGEEKLIISEVIDNDDLDMGDQGWSNDDHNGRSCRITAKGAVTLQRNPSAISVTGENGNEYTTVANMATQDSSMAGGDSLGTTGDMADFLVYLTFDVPRCPDGKYKLTIWFSAYCTTHADNKKWNICICDSDGVTYSDVIYTAYSENDDMVYATRTELTIDIDDKDLAHYINADKQIKFRIDSGYQKDGALDYKAGFYIYFAELQFNDGYQHPPMEFLIADTIANFADTSDKLTLTIDAGIIDLVTKGINDGDLVDILYKNEEWVEDHIPDDAGDLNDVIAQASVAATHTLMDFMFVHQNIEDICTREAWYRYMTRLTTGGKPDLVFAERGAPPNYGITILPENIADPTGENIKVDFKAFDKCRGVIVKSKTGWAGYSSAGACSKNGTAYNIPAGVLPVIVLNRPEIPDAYLAGVAQAVYLQRNSVPTIVRTKIRSVQYWLEQFLGYTDGQDPTSEGDAGWVDEAGCDHDGTDIIHTVDATGGERKLYLKDADRTKQLIISLGLSVDIIDDKTLRIKGKFLTCSGGSANCFLGIQLNEGTTVGVHLGLLLTTGLIYYSTDNTETTTADMTTTGVTATVSVSGTTGYIWVKMENIGASSTFKIAYTTNSTDTPSYSSAFAMANDLTTAVDTILLYTPDANDDGGAVAVETCSTHTDGNDIAGDAAPNGTWNSPAPAANCSAKWKDEGSGALCAEFIDASAVGGTGDPKLVFSSAGSPDGTASLSYKVKVTNTAGLNVLVAEGVTYRVGIQLAAGGGIIGGSGWADLGIGSWTLNTWHTIEIVFLSTSQFKCRLDGGSWSANKNNNNGDWSGAGAVIDTFWQSGSTAGTYAVRYDDIQVSWVSAYTTKTLEAYIYELWSDAAGSGNVNVQDCLPQYFHVGAKARLRAAPTTKGGTDYQIDEDLVIRKLTWLHDGFCDLELGFDELETKSPEETLVDLIARNLHSSTST